MNIIPFRLQIFNKTVHQFRINTWQRKDNLWFQHRNNLVLKARLLIKLE